MQTSRGAHQAPKATDFGHGKVKRRWYLRVPFLTLLVMPTAGAAYYTSLDRTEQRRLRVTLEGFVRFVR